MVVFGVHTSLVPACGYRLMCLETPCTVWYNLTTGNRAIVLSSFCGGWTNPGFPTVYCPVSAVHARIPLPLLEMRRLATSTTTTVSWTRRDCVVTGRWRQWHWPSPETDCPRTEVALVMSQCWTVDGWHHSMTVLSAVMTFFSTPNVMW